MSNPLKASAQWRPVASEPAATLGLPYSRRGGPLGGLTARGTVGASRSATLDSPDQAPRPPSPSAPPAALHAAPAHVLTRTLFAGALGREVRRADRRGSPLTLALIEPGTSSPQSWSEIVSAARTALGDMTLVGWLEENRRLAVVVLDDGAADCGALRPSELQLTATAAVSIRWQSYLPPHSGGMSGDDESEQVREWAFGPRQNADYPLKRTLDLLGSSLLLILLSPLFLLIALAVKLTSPGPVLFRQERVGRRASPFTMLKFRTMRVERRSGAAPRVRDQVHQVGRAAAPGGSQSGVQAHQRPAGHAARPHPAQDQPRRAAAVLERASAETCRSWGHGRRSPTRSSSTGPGTGGRVLDAKPGVTGLWQVKGRSRTTFDEMVRLDLRYARTLLAQD